MTCWTCERPTKQGWYWWREEEHATAVVVRIAWDTVAKTTLYMIVPPDSIWSEGMIMDLTNVRGSWAGPLDAPATTAIPRVRNGAREGKWMQAK